MWGITFIVIVTFNVATIVNDNIQESKKYQTNIFRGVLDNNYVLMMTSIVLPDL